MQNKTFPIELIESRMLSPNVKHFVFHCQLDPVFDPLPGQFITLVFEKEGQVLRRSYSIANPPKGENRIEFAASYVKHGPASELLFNLKPHDTLQAMGPFGRLILKNPPPKRFILVATSTGVTPYRAMIEELASVLEKNPDLEVVIIQGGQQPEDILYVEDFTQFAQHPRVHFRAQLSRAEQVDETRHQYQGYVQTAFPQLNLNPQEDLIYLCGNPSMVDDSFEQLKNLGFEVNQIIREKYISR